MNRSQLLPAAALVALCGCASKDKEIDATEVRFPRLVFVSVVNGISVDDLVDVSQNNGAIRWGFLHNPLGYVFPEGGIKFDPHPPAPPASMNCTSQPDPDQYFNTCKPLWRGAVFQCVKTRQHVLGACFKYDIKVELPGGGAPITLDPWVQLR